MHDAIADAALADDLIDAIGDVDELRAVAGDPIQHPVEHLESPCIQRRARRSFRFIQSDFDFRDLGIRTHARSLT